MGIHPIAAAHVRMLPHDDALAVALLNSPAGLVVMDGPPGNADAHALWQACRALLYGCPDCPEPRPVAAFTRDSAQVGLCAEHLEQAELDNEHADGHHTTEPHPACGACQAPQA